jgi:hypothetical protein
LYTEEDLDPHAVCDAQHIAGYVRSLKYCVEPSDSDLDRVIDLNAEWRKLPPFIGTFLLRCGRRKGSGGSLADVPVFSRAHKRYVGFKI